MATWVIPAIMAGSSLLGGILGSQNTAQNANNVQAASQYNAEQQLLAGRQTAMLSGMMGDYNAQLSLLSGEANAESLLAVSQYNANLQSLLSEANAQAIESEISLLFEERDLNVMQLEQHRAVTVGSVQADQSASGTVMGQDSAADVVIDLNTQFALDEFIIRHSADIQGTRLINAASKSRWEGELARRQILWEGDVAGWSTITQSRLNAEGLRMQGSIDSQSILINSRAQAQTTLNTGNAARQSGMLNSKSQFFGSILGGISAGAQGYGLSSLTNSLTAPGTSLLTAK